MKRVTLPLLLWIGIAAIASPAWASDASLKSALKPYETRLTSDIAYLAAFSVPSKSKAGATLTKLAKIGKDLAGATHAASSNQGSTKNGKKGRSLVISGLSGAISATQAAEACAKAVRSGKHAAAASDRKREKTDINKAIPLLEAGGKLLHLF